jgi:hypothetical protein
MLSARLPARPTTLRRSGNVLYDAVFVSPGRSQQGGRDEPNATSRTPFLLPDVRSGARHSGRTEQRERHERGEGPHADDLHRSGLSGRSVTNRPPTVMSASPTTRTMTPSRPMVRASAFAETVSAIVAIQQPTPPTRASHPTTGRMRKFAKPCWREPARTAQECPDGGIRPAPSVLGVRNRRFLGFSYRTPRNSEGSMHSSRHSPPRSYPFRLASASEQT